MEESGAPEVPLIQSDRPNLLFHITTTNRAEFMREHGMIVDNSYHLTPSLELAVSYRNQKADGMPVMTFWYPEKQEVVRNRHPIVTRPTTLVTEEQRGLVIARIKQDGILSDSIKEQLTETVKGAERILSPSRLKAIITVERYSELFDNFPREFYENGLERYTDPEERQKLFQEVRTMLDNSIVVYLAEGKTLDDLAKDMVGTAVEHDLCTVGWRLKEVIDGVRKKDPNYLNVDELKKFWFKKKARFESLHFEEQLYERYRNLLVGKIGQFLEQA